jgi:hypothetical protein
MHCQLAQFDFQSGVICTSDSKLNLFTFNYKKNRQNRVVAPWNPPLLVPAVIIAVPLGTGTIRPPTLRPRMVRYVPVHYFPTFLYPRMFPH